MAFDNDTFEGPSADRLDDIELQLDSPTRKITRASHARDLVQREIARLRKEDGDDSALSMRLRPPLSPPKSRTLAVAKDNLESELGLSAAQMDRHAAKLIHRGSKARGLKPKRKKDKS